MHKGTKIALFTGLGILIFGVLLSVTAFALSGFRFRNAFASEIRSTDLKTIELEFPETFTNIDISTPSADIFVYPSDSKVARIEYTAQADDMEYEAYVKDDTLVFRRMDNVNDMRWTNPAQIMDNIASLISTGSFDEKDLKLYLPKREYQKLTISSASGEIVSNREFSIKEVSLASVSGEISLSNLKKAENVSLNTTSGSIHISDMDIKSDLNAFTVSGEFTLEHVKAGGKLLSSTTSGEIILREASFEDAELETVSGDISLENVTAKALSANTVSADVKGRVDSSIDVHASSVSGEIRVPDGNGDKWYIETTSGDIHLHS